MGVIRVMGMVKVMRRMIMMMMRVIDELDE